MRPNPQNAGKTSGSNRPVPRPGPMRPSIPQQNRNVSQRPGLNPMNQPQRPNFQQQKPMQANRQVPALPNRGVPVQNQPNQLNQQKPMVHQKPRFPAQNVQQRVPLSGPQKPVPQNQFQRMQPQSTPQMRNSNPRPGFPQQQPPVRGPGRAGPPQMGTRHQNGALNQSNFATGGPPNGPNAARRPSSQFPPRSGPGMQPKQPNPAFGRGPQKQPPHFGQPKGVQSNPIQRGMSAPAPPGQPMPGVQQQTFVPQVPLDLSCNANKDFKSFTTDKFPASSIVHDQSAMPLACIITPLAELEEEIPVVNFGNVGVVRCKRCRAYMNPFVIWLDNGRKWQCNLCSSHNETHANYYRHLDDKFQRIDKMQRAELHSGCYEIMAPAEYCVRPPMPPVYVFCFEVSRESKLTGLLSTAIASVRKLLDSLAESPRAQIGFISYDEAVSFYNLRSDLDSPQVLTIPEIDNLFLPLPAELLVNLQESRETVDKLLDSLEASVNSFISQQQSQQQQQQSYDAGVCLGSALNGAYNMMAHVGGKLSVFMSKIPSTGVGKLAPRGANVNVLGTMSEHTFFRPSTGVVADPKAKKGDKQNQGVNFYKTKAGEFVRQQISCDLYVLPPHQSSYTDLATVSEVAKFSSGEINFYGNCAFSVAHSKLESDLTRALTRVIGLEAVMRVRASQGVVAKGFYGNFLLRGSDLMAIPCLSADATFAVEFGFDGGVAADNPGVPLRKDLHGPVTIQTGLLYTNREGERRIRVITMALPITKSVSEVISSGHLPTIVNLFGKKGVDIVTRTGLDDFKRKLQTKTVEVLRAYRSFNQNLQSVNGQVPNGPPGSAPGAQSSVHVDLILPPALRELPRFIQGICKSLVFRGGNEVPLDFRCGLFDVVSRSSNVFVKSLFDPQLYDLLNDKKQQCSINSLRADGVFCLDFGTELFVWVGRNVKPGVLGDLFGAQNIQSLEESQLTGFLLSELKKAEGQQPPLRAKLFTFIRKLRKEHKGIPVLSPRVAKDGESYEDHLFKSLLVDDRQQFNGGSMSFDEFLQFLLQQSQSSSGRGSMRR